MLAGKYTYLKFVKLKDIERWDIKSLSANSLSSNYSMVKLSSLLSSANIEWIDIEDDKTYPILGVHAHGEGVYINKVVLGKELTMKQYQKSKVNTLFYCKVRTVNGQWGVVFPEYANSYGSSNMQYLEINFDLINPYFLLNLLKIRKLTDTWDAKAIGADGRHFTLTTLLQLQIPLPSLSEQQTIIDSYNKRIKKAQELEEQTAQIEKEIEEYLLSELNISITKAKLHKGLNLIRFKDVDRWDCYNGGYSIATSLKKSPYPIVEIGKIFDFTQRKWDKKEKEFNYVEIGAVDPLKGIMYTEKIQTSKAPSRATQRIKTGDLIVGTTRPYLKKFAIVGAAHNDCVCSSGFQVIAPKEEYNLSYLYEYLKSSVAIAQFELFMSGALYPAITGKDLKKILLPLPPIEVQDSIVDHINKQKVQMKQMKQRAEELRKKALEEFEKEIFI